VTYTIIKRSEIPLPPPSTNEHYGEWLAMARMMRLLAPDQAVRVELKGQTSSAAVSSIHCAARRVGMTVSTMRLRDQVFVVRTGVTEIEADPPMTFDCRHCRQTNETTTPNQEYCRKAECQGARKRKNNRALRERRRAKKGGE
jgi:hypothetical protein